MADLPHFFVWRPGQAGKLCGHCERPAPHPIHLQPGDKRARDEACENTAAHAKGLIAAERRSK